MAIRTLRVLGRNAEGETSIGVTLPKDELRLDGLVDDDGEPIDVPVAISRDERGRWIVEVLELPPDDPDDEIVEIVEDLEDADPERADQLRRALKLAAD